jgi:ATP-dependent Lhr-like helicase
LAGGRWSLVSDLIPAEGELSDTERTLARARQLLERYGVVSREAVAAEGLAGGFGPVYRVLKQMEETGRVRRGYFVEGLSGAQFALPAAVERLRGARLDEPPMDGFGADAVRVLAAIDPANPYGALLPWPATGGDAGSTPGEDSIESRAEPQPRSTGATARTRGTGALRRVAGARVILVAGAPVLYLAAGGRALITFPDSIGRDGAELALALETLTGLSGTGRGRLLIRQIDDVPALQSPLRESLIGAGFESDYDALVPVPAGTQRAGAPGGIGRDPNAIPCAGGRRTLR